MKSKEEMIITNTYINTRIPPEEEKKQVEEEKDPSTFRKQLENNIPKNNRNVNQKSSTYNNELKSVKPTTKIKWREQLQGKKNLLFYFIFQILSKN